MKEKSIYTLFKELVEFNNNCEWINPKLVYSTKEEFKDLYFCIEVDDFTAVITTPDVEFFNITKRKRITLFFKRI